MSNKYAADSDEDMLYGVSDRADRVGEWRSATTSWTFKSSTTDDRHSALPPSGLRALYEVRVQ